MRAGKCRQCKHLSLTEQGFDNIARLTYTTKSVALHMAEKVKSEFNKKSVAIISENQDYGQQLLKSFKERAYLPWRQSMDMMRSW